MSRPTHRRRSLPIAAVFTIELVVAALIPLTLAVMIIAARGRMAVQHAAERNLQLVAQALATRLDQMLLDVQGRLIQIAEDDRIVRFCTADEPSRQSQVDLIRAQFQRIRANDPEVATIFVADLSGIGILGSDDHQFGQDFNFREYFREARAGRPHVSGVLVGVRSRKAGIYFSAPVRDGDRVVGVAVLKLDARRLDVVIAAIDARDATAAISNGEGIVISHVDREKLYHSFGPLDAAAVDRVDPMVTFGIQRLEDLGMDDLMGPLTSGTAGATVHHSPDGSGRRIVGHAPLSAKPWMASVMVPASTFEAPMLATLRQQIGLAFILALGAGGYALLRGVRLVRPLTTLTRAATGVAQGDLDVRVPAKGADEIGRLGRAFNTMIPRLREHMELRHSIKLAREVQRAMLPEVQPRVAGIDVCGHSRPCAEFAGDYFDFIDVAEVPGGTLIAIADVVGHGIGSALIMASARGALRAAVTDHGDLSEVMRTLNLIVSQDCRDGSFMTFLLMLIDVRGGKLRWVTAGHDPGMIVRPDSEKVIQLEGEDSPLGVVHETRYDVMEMALPPVGSVLFIGTDGVWESCDGTNQLYGKSRLHRFLLAQRGRRASEVAAALDAELQSFCGDRQLDDDVTFVVVRFTDPRSANSESRSTER